MLCSSMQGHKPTAVNGMQSINAQLACCAGPGSHQSAPSALCSCAPGDAASAVKMSNKLCWRVICSARSHETAGQESCKQVKCFVRSSATCSIGGVVPAADRPGGMCWVQAEEDLRRQQCLVAYLKEHSGRLKLDNLELHERVRLLERLPMFKYGRESACMLEFTAYKIRETY